MLRHRSIKSSSMATPCSCACKGIRKCRVCEVAKEVTITTSRAASQLHTCYRCGQIFTALLEQELETTPEPPLQLCSPDCTGDTKELQVGTGSEKDREVVGNFSGVFVVKEFVSEEEENSIVAEIDRQKWAESQSGRRKQDYGPKVNFKQQKIKLGSFNGLPLFSKLLLERMHSTLPQLMNFEPVELCNLEYVPERGSAIDPHRDDSWLWGERLVTLNLLSPTLLTFSTPTHPHKSSDSQLHSYNSSVSPLHTKEHTKKTNTNILSRDSLSSIPITHDFNIPLLSQAPPKSQASHQSPPSDLIELHVPLPRQSLVIVEGPARHSWLHAIKRENILSRRIAVTLRELTPEFLPGGRSYEGVGQGLLDIASKFDGQPTNFSTQP